MKFFVVVSLAAAALVTAVPTSAPNDIAKRQTTTPAAATCIKCSDLFGPDVATCTAKAPLSCATKFLYKATCVSPCPTGYAPDANKVCQIIPTPAVTPTQGYGRFGCSLLNGDGTYSPDQTRCVDSALIAPGANNDGGDQIDGLSPTNAQCVRQPDGAGYFCGGLGATCTSSANCDNGICVSGKCAGGFGYQCMGQDSNCLGALYCSSDSFMPSKTCGGNGAYCQDAITSGLSAAEAQGVFNQFCRTGYCSETTANCGPRLASGAVCTRKPFGCPVGQSCKNGVCAA